jgi:hypothetical protein
VTQKPKTRTRPNFRGGESPGEAYQLSIYDRPAAVVFRNLYKYTDSGILAAMPKPIPRLKPLTFLGSSRDDLREMPTAVRHAIGVELMTVQLGGTPTDFKPIASVGAGAHEIRVAMSQGHFARCT